MNMKMIDFVMCAVMLGMTCAAPYNNVQGAIQTGCGGKPADVIFVLDASSSIWGPDFTKQVDFVHSVVAEFDVASSATRVGLITFSDEPEVVLPLDEYNDRYTTTEGIGSTIQTYGGTKTDMALLMMNEMFQLRGRRDVPHIAIVMTDGQSDYPQLTVQEAIMVRDSGITVFAIGIGDRVDDFELTMIASEPEYVFTVNSFDALVTIREMLAISACEVELPAIRPEVEVEGDKPSSEEKPGDDNHENEVIKPTKPSLEKGCDGKPADIVFCLDASGSIWGPDFRKQLDFVQDITSVFEISPEITRIGMLTFGDSPQDWFKLSEYATEEDVRAAIGATSQSRGGTNTAAALMETRMNYFSRDEVRPGVVRIAVVITDGKSENREQTRIEAQRLRAEGVHVFAVGVGEGVVLDELDVIASAPSDDFVFTVDNYAALASIRKLLALKTCQVTDPPTTTSTTTTTTTTTPPITRCGKRRPADVVFGLPPASSQQETNDGLDFVKRVAAALELGEDKVHVGLVPKECHPVPGFDLNEANTKEDILERLDGGYAAAQTSEVIKYMRRRSFDDESGAREDAQKFGIVVLSGASNDRKTLAREAVKARSNNIELFVIKVGDVPDADVRAVVGGSEEGHVFEVPSFAELADVAEELVVTLNTRCVEL